jgi:hypothetical protein
MAPQDRLAQVSSHLNYPKGLLAGQTAIITGSGQGIGAECARLFANEGAKVVVCDIDARTPPPPFLPVSVPIPLPLPSPPILKLTIPLSTAQKKATKSPPRSTPGSRTAPSPCPAT